MVRHMPYVQQWKGSYRFRRRVPDHLKPIIGKPEWVAALGTKDKAEANRLVVPHIGRTDQIIRDAERGDYPPLPNDRIEPIACDWWRWFCQERAKLFNVGAGLISNGLDPHLDTRSNRPCAITTSTHSVFPDSTSPPKLNPVEPPWYGPVCPVVGEGWHREVSPYPNLRRIA